MEPEEEPVLWLWFKVLRIEMRPESLSQSIEPLRQGICVGGEAEGKGRKEKELIFEILILQMFNWEICCLIAKLIFAPSCLPFVLNLQCSAESTSTPPGLNDHLGTGRKCKQTGSRDPPRRKSPLKSTQNLHFPSRHRLHAP